MSKGKRYVDALKGFDRDRFYSPGEAIDFVKSLAAAKFDESVEVAVRLGVDPRRADQIVRGSLALPAGTGKTKRVAVFASGEAAACSCPGPSMTIPLVSCATTPLDKRSCG